MNGSVFNRYCATLAAAFAASLSSPAIAQSDDGSIIAAYKLYNSAVEAGDVEAMLDYAELAWERAGKEWEADNIQLGYLASNYGKALSLNEKYRQAVEAYGDCIEVLEQHLPDTVTDLANCWQGLAMAQLYREKQDEAIAALEQVIAVTEQQPGDALNDKMRADAHYMIANIVGDAEIRGEHAEKAMPLLVKVYGEKSIEVAEANKFIGLAVFNENPQAALANYKLAWEIRRDIKGDEDLATVRAKARYEYLEYTLKDLDEQKKMWADPEECTVIETGSLSFLDCLLHRAEPEYPDGIRTNEGDIATVVLAFDIDTDGTVTNIRVVESSHEAFSNVCVDALSQWKYVPPVDANGQPTVRADMVTVYRFQLI